MDQREIAARARVADAMRELRAVLRENGRPASPREMEQEQRRARIAERFRPGVSASQVARTLSMNTNTVIEDFRAMGWPVLRPGRPKGKGAPSARNLVVLTAVQAEPRRTLDDFGRQFGVTRERIRQIIAKYGVQKVNMSRNNPHNPVVAERKAQTRAEIAARKAQRAAERAEKIAAAAKLYASGLSVAKVAEQFGVGIMVAYKRIRAARDAGLL